MRVADTESSYSPISRTLHWVIAVLALFLFGLGLYMRDLGYYDPNYQRLPALHKSIGLGLMLVFVLRLAWRLIVRGPRPLASLSAWERVGATWMHLLLLWLLAGLLASGYLLATGDGRPASAFGIDVLPAIFSLSTSAQAWAGQVHLALAYALVGCTGLHAIAAFKHHLVDGDVTLKRMTWNPPHPDQSPPEESKP
ncbi:MAG: cytochrome b [Pseudomonadota bacterium]|nr:cytochrome b [Pseudomonadota bacterium]